MLSSTHNIFKLIRSSSSGLSLFIFISAAPAIAQQASGGNFISADQQGSVAADKLFSREAPPADGNQGLSGQASAGLVTSTGNAENNIVTAGIAAKYIIHPWRHTVTTNIYFAESNGEKKAERYALSYKINYAMGTNGYLFNFASYDADEFSNIDYRLADVIGYGRTLIDTDKHNLEAELGLGLRQTQFTDTTPDSDETVGHLGLNYTGKLTDTTTLTENLLIQSGSDNTFSESVTALNVKMTEKLSLSLNYTVRNNSDAPDGFEKTDTVTSVNLVAGF